MTNPSSNSPSKLSYSKVARIGSDKGSSPSLTSSQESQSPTLDQQSQSGSTLKASSPVKTRAILDDSQKRLISNIIQSNQPCNTVTFTIEPESQVTLTITDGIEMKGICANSHTTTQNASSILLKQVKKIAPSTGQFKPLEGTMTIKVTDIIKISEIVPPTTTKQVDRIIHSPKGVNERELHRWQPDEGASVDQLDHVSLDQERVRNDNAGWDQFAVNEKLFGCRSTFEEEFYTTKLDKSSPDYKRREKEAERIAREISSLSSSNVHLQEERGHAVAADDSMNEEDRYSTVIRNPNAYVPPAFRKKNSHPTVESKTTSESTSMETSPKEPIMNQENVNSEQEKVTEKSEPKKDFKFNVNALEFKPKMASLGKEIPPYMQSHPSMYGSFPNQPMGMTPLSMMPSFRPGYKVPTMPFLPPSQYQMNQPYGYPTPGPSFHSSMMMAVPSSIVYGQSSSYYPQHSASSNLRPHAPQSSQYIQPSQNAPLHQPQTPTTNQPLRSPSETTNLAG